MKLGLVFQETFRGSFHLLSDPLVERAADLHFTVTLAEWRQMAKDGIARVAGDATLEGLADHATFDGSVRFRLRSENRIPYDVTFAGLEGHRYRLRAQREPHPASPFEIITNLRFSLHDAENGDAEIGRGLARCDLRTDVRHTLRTMRLRSL